MNTATEQRAQLRGVTTPDLEKCAQVSLAADAEHARLLAELARQEGEFEHSSLTSTAAEYGKLQSALNQARDREIAARRYRDTKRQALDKARGAEAERLQRETARRLLEVKTREVDEARTLLESKNAQLAVLRDEVPRLQSEFNRRIFELARLREQYPAV